LAYHRDNVKIVPMAEALARVADLTKALRDGALVCIPIGGTYRLVADLRSDAAVTRLMQSKRRAKSHPALVLVPSLTAAKGVVDGTGWTVTRRLAERVWPRPLTLLLPPSDELTNGTRRMLTRATGTVGVRMTDEPLAAAVVKTFGAPLLVSSANLEHKPGAASAAAVRQRFSTTVELWIDAGDVAATPPSTLVEVTADAWKLVRAGAVSVTDVERAVA
jgi:L-threonylcarbamoyladenylate synthase